MHTTALTQMPAPAIDFRTDRSDMDKKMVARAPRNWVFGGIEASKSTVGIHIESLDRPMFARVLGKAGKMIMWIVVMEAVLPPTLLPTVGGALSTQRCMSDWGDNATASLGYKNSYWSILAQGKPVRWLLCMRSWMTSENIRPCERYAIPMNETGHRSIILKHQLSFQYETDNDGWITLEHPDLAIEFTSDKIILRALRHNNESSFDFFQGVKRYAWAVGYGYWPAEVPSFALPPQNLCAAQEASSLAGYATTVATNAFYRTANTVASVAATVVGQIATSLMNYPQSQCCAGMPNNATIIAPDQEESSESLNYNMIAIGFGGIAALLASAYAILYVIKKSTRAADRDPDLESISLKNTQTAL